MTDRRAITGSILAAILSTASVTVPAYAQAAEPNDPTVSRPAEEKPQAERLNEEGTRLFQAGQFRRALEVFIEAHALDPEPNLIFNMARCYEGLDDLDGATEKYSAFLDAAGADAEGATRARAALVRLRAKKDTRSRVTGASHVARLGQVKSNVASESPAASRKGRYWPWLTLGLAGVSGVAGSTLYILGSIDHHRVTSAAGYGDANGVDVMTEARARALSDSGRTKKTLGLVGFAGAGAFLATSLVLFWTRDAPGEQVSERTPRLLLRAGADTGGVNFALHGAF